MESALPTTLNECKVDGTSLYRVSWLLRFVEGLTAKQSANRWSVLKQKFPDIKVFKHERNVCIAEDDLKSFVSKLKECPNKTSNMESALPTTLNECKVDGTSLYRVSWLLRFVEGLTTRQSANRWSVLKQKFPDIKVFKHERNVCVTEDDLKSFVSKLKECPNKTAIIGASAADETKVRNVTLHAGGQEVHLEVSCASFLLKLL